MVYSLLYLSINQVKNKQQKESVINGKTMTDSCYYITLSVYQKNKLDAKIKSIISHNENFIIYNDKYFKKLKLLV